MIVIILRYYELRRIANYALRLLWSYEELSWLSDGWSTVGLYPNHPWVLSYWVETPIFISVLEIVIV